MELIADGLLIAAAATAAFYCWVLARRLKALRDLDTGLGGAIASLSAQVDETRSSLANAKSATNAQSKALEELTERAEAAAGRLERMIAEARRLKTEPQPAEAAPSRRERPARAARKPEAAPTPPESQAQPRQPAAQTPVQNAVPARQSRVSAPQLPELSPPQVPGAPPAAVEKEDAKTALITRLRGLAQTSAS